MLGNIYAFLTWTHCLRVRSSRRSNDPSSAENHRHGSGPPKSRLHRCDRHTCESNRCVTQFCNAISRNLFIAHHTLSLPPPFLSVSISESSLSLSFCTHIHFSVWMEWVSRVSPSAFAPLFWQMYTCACTRVRGRGGEGET